MDEDAIREIHGGDSERDDGEVTFKEWKNYFKKLSCQYQDDEAFFAEFAKWNVTEAYID